MGDTPVLKKAEDRKASIISNTPAVFLVENNPNANHAKPIYELEGQSEVERWCGVIIQIAQKHRIDSSLVMAIMYMETTHGWYDSIYPFRKTILPMNIHCSYWRRLGVTPEQLKVPAYNVEYGVIILSRIRDRVQNPTTAKIATLYNNLAAERVSDYGARVAYLYWEKPWIRKGCGR